MKEQFYIIIIFIASISNIYGQKPNVVVLGVEHSSQLINSNHQPAALRAFIKKVNPSAICIERSPEEFANNDFYEFTYEQQNVVVPFSKQHKIPIHPIDWLPQDSNLKLAFGTANLEIPNFTRNPSGFWGFTIFSDSTSYDKSLYFADSEEYSNTNKKWYAPYPEKINFDFARRLFLYRTFLQAKRVQAVLKNFKENDTILVVIGALHKNDIEKNLEGNGYKIIQPGSNGKISTKEIDNNFNKQDAYAILSFNLLGMQSHINIINNELVNFAFDKLKQEKNPEKEFFKIKYDLLNNNINSKTAISGYKNLLNNSNTKKKFTWNGVKDTRRIDSYFDPFGNLTLDQRVQLELAREYLKTSEHKLFEASKNSLIKELSRFKQSMLLEYIDMYLKK